MNNNGRSRNKAPVTRNMCLSLILATFVLVFGVWALFNVYSYSVSDGETELYERDLMQEYQIGADNFKSQSLEGIYDVKRVYMIPDGVITAPKPVQSAFGTAAQLGDLRDVIVKAEQYGLVNGTDLALTRDEAHADTAVEIEYYLDETIFTVTWKTEIRGDVYNFTEVVISHPSQFRKYITNNEYASSTRKTVSTMSKELNAVIGMSADFYAYRGIGVVVYNKKLYRSNVNSLDNCFIDVNGDMIMTKRKTIDYSEIEDFVNEHDINFSLCFGPVIVENGELAQGYNEDYRLGQVFDEYSRAALGQLGPLHYLLCTVDGGTYSLNEFRMGLTVVEIAQQMDNMGCISAYVLDGGQTATMTVNGRVFNKVGYGSERPVSDIIFFATALPESARSEEQ